MDNKKKPQVQPTTPAASVSTQPLLICLNSDCNGERTFMKTDNQNPQHAGHETQLFSDVQALIQQQKQQSLAKEKSEKQSLQDAQVNQHKENELTEFLVKWMPLFRFTNLDITRNRIMLFFLRITMGIFFSKNFIYPDEYWQGTEVAYHLVYGGVDLTWEWQPDSMIRSFIYPLYLSLPLRILRTLRFDSAVNVRSSYYVAQAILVYFSDVYFYKLANTLIGKNGARISLLLYLTMKFYNIYVIRCFGNSVESVLSIIIFYYLVRVQRKLNKDLCLTVFLIVLQFFIRCTSIAAWVPLFLWKIFNHPKLIHKCVLAAVYVGIPTLMLCVWIDSKGYRVWTFTVFNFVQKNILEDVSSRFGISETSYYFMKTIPYQLNLVLIPCAIQILIELDSWLNGGNFPALLFFSGTQITLLSLVPHKEDRFIQAAIPFLLILIGKWFLSIFRNPKLKKLGLLLLICTVFYEIMLHASFIRYEQKRYLPIEDIMTNDASPQYVYHTHRLQVPYYSMFHKKKSEKKVELLYSRVQGGTFGGVTMGDQDPWDSLYQCRDIANAIQSRQFINPRYVILNEFNPSNGYNITNCIDGLKRHGYKMIKKYECEAGTWKERLRVEFQPVYLFRRD